MFQIRLKNLKNDMENINNLKIEKGTVNFLIKKDTLVNPESIPLFSISPEGGSIFMIKDSDNKLKVFFVALGKGRQDLIFDLSTYKFIGQKYTFTFTWSLNSKKLLLYIDGVLVKSVSIPF